MSQQSVTICNVMIDIEPDAEHLITASQLRGYLGHLFIDDTEFHHHDDNPYRYPLIQYKKIRNKLSVIGINDYASMVQKIASIDHITLPSKKVKIMSIKFNTKKYTIKEIFTKYTFVSPWIALNGSNFNAYKKLERNLQREFLENILVGNLLSTLKGIGINTKYHIQTNIGMFTPTSVLCHNTQFLAFKLNFATNVEIPNLIGLGKSVSKGFGAIQRSEHDH